MSTVGNPANIFWHENPVRKAEREKFLNQLGCVVWITGPSGSGKSTLACSLGRELQLRGMLSYVLDGDNLRHSLNKNLGFSPESRTEDIRRTDEEKEKEIQIGFPTDVKHVAHIGWDGPSTDNNPSWMKEFNGQGQFQSAPLVPPPADNPEIKWVSEDSNRRSRNVDSSSAGDQPRSTRRHSSKENGGTDSPKKSRSSRRHHRKDSTEGSKHGRIQLDSSAESESPARDLPDIPKKSRRKKSKESVPGGTVTGSRSSKSKGTSSSTAAAPASDPIS